jgi:hypothetical protein
LVQRDCAVSWLLNDFVAGVWHPPARLPPPRPPMPGQNYTYPAFPLAPIQTPRFDIPPPAPEIDGSPTFSSASEHTWSSFSSGSPPPNAPTGHWAMGLLNRAYPNTPFRDPGMPYVLVAGDLVIEVVLISILALDVMGGSIIVRAMCSSTIASWRCFGSPFGTHKSTAASSGGTLIIVHAFC